MLIKILRFTLIGAMATASLPYLYGQNDAGRIVGNVTDASGAAVPNASITAVDEKTGSERKVVADGAGYFILPNLSVFTTYKITAQANGFAKWEASGVPLSVGQERTLAVKMQPASLTTAVTVSGGELTVLETSSAAVSANVNAREVAQLPLNGRQLSQLYLLAPGAQTAGGGSFDNIRFSGRANQENAVRFDGVEASSIIDASPGNLNGEVSTGFRLQNSLETISEFRVDSSNYPAEFGTGTAGQISVISKSGGNEFHGGLFEYFRNNALDTRNFFDGTSKTALRLNQFGGSAGGAIQKDKLFFFVAQESLEQRAGVNLIGTVPSTSARARAVSSIQPLLAGYPTGTPTTNPDLDLAQRVYSLSINEYFGSFRIDHRINDKLTQYLRYNRDQGYLTQPLDVTGSGQIVTGVPQNVVYTLSQILKPTVVNETKLGFNGNKTRINGYTPLIPGVDTSAFAVSFTGTVAIPGIGGQGASAGAASLGNLVRGNSSQNGRGQPYTNYTMAFIDNLSVIHREHALKFGGEFRPVRLYTDRQGGTTYTFPNITAMLANQPTNIQVLGDTSSPDPFNNGATGNRFLKQYYLIFYAQDEWKVKPNLTINFGMRWEYYSVIHEDRNLFVLFNADTGKIACGASACDLPNTTPWYHTKKTNFGPRLGISWSPSAMQGKTVLRVGSGYYYGPGQTEDQVQPIDSDRASRTLTTGVAFPVNPATILGGYDITSPTLGYQPRAYGDGYTLPEKVLSYTASVQQQLPGAAVLTVAYVGSTGRNLFLRSWTNGIVGVTTNPTTGAGSAILKYGARYAQIDFKTSGGTDHYDSMQTTLNRRFSKGLTAGLQWTYGHSIGNTGGSNEAQTTQNPFNYGQDRGNNAFDVRHSMNASVLYQVPFKSDNKIANYLAGGWEVGGIVNARTGLPIDVTLSRPDIVYQINGTNQYVQAPILNGTTVTTTAVIDNPYGGAFRNNRRPSVVAGVDPFLHTGDGRFFLNPAAFTFPTPGQFGNLGRFALHGPGLSQFDFTTHKKFPIDEKRNLEFRAEFYNLFNHANFANPPAVLATGLGTASNQIQPGQPYSPAVAGAAFGVFNSTVSKDVGLGAQRQIQLSLRLNF